jgi:hypothetical protein
VVKLAQRSWCVKVAAYRAPLLAAGSMDALDLIRARVRVCEAEGVAILCCPEAILGGLADEIEDPARLAISYRVPRASNIRRFRIDHCGAPATLSVCVIRTNRARVAGKVIVVRDPCPCPCATGLLHVRPSIDVCTE